MPLGFHFNLVELVWTLVAALGLWICIRLYLGAVKKKKLVVEGNWNGPRLIVVKSAVRRNEIRILTLGLMFVIGLSAGLYEEVPDWVGVFSIVGLITIAVLIVYNAALDSTEEKKLFRYFIEKEATIERMTSEAQDIKSAQDEKDKQNLQNLEEDREFGEKRRDLEVQHNLQKEGDGDALQKQKTEGISLQE